MGEQKRFFERNKATAITAHMTHDKQGEVHKTFAAVTAGILAFGAFWLGVTSIK